MKNGDSLCSTAPTNAGTYTASFELGGVTASVDFTIAPKPITPSSINGTVTKTYDGTNTVPENHGLSIVLDGIVGSEVVTATATYAYDGVDAGTTSIMATNIALTGEDSGNYTLSATTVSANVGEITKAPPTVTAPTANTLTYNGGNQALVTAGETNGGTLYYVLGDNGTTAPEDGWTTDIPTATNAGTYYVWYKVVEDTNYADASYAAITVTISPKSITPTIDGLDSVYAHTGNPIEPTVTVKDGNTTLEDGTDYDVTYSGNTDVGTATVIVTPKGNYKGSATATFEIKTHIHDWKYTTRGNTIIAECVGTIGSCDVPDPGSITIAAPESLVYDESAKAAVVTGTLYTGADVTVVYDTADGKAPVNVGKYNASMTIDTANISVSYEITKAASSGTVTAVQGLTYNGSAQTLVNCGTVTGGTMMYKLGEDGTYSENIPTGTDADNYIVYYYVKGDSNHEDTTPQSVSVDIGKIDPTYTIPTGLTATYGDTLASITLPDGFTWTDNSLSVGNAGTNDFTVVYTPSDTKNYNTITGITVEVTVAKKQLVISGMSWEVPENAVYNGSEYSAKLNGTLPTGVTATLSGDKATNAGSYTAKAVFSLAEGYSSANYELVNATGLTEDWSIAKAQAEITVDTTPISVTYGDKVTLPTATSNFGTVDCDTIADNLKNADTYTVTYTVAGTDNYEGDTKTVTVIIGQKEVAEPTVTGTYTYTGNEQTVVLDGVESYMTIASGNKGTDAKSYEVVITLDNNHKWADGSDGRLKWSIGKAAVTITAENKVIYIGAALPALTYQVSGLVNGEELTKNPTLTTNADEDQAGSYTITAANADAGDNYTITYVSGTLTIMDAETEVETKIEQTELTEVPDGLKDTEFNTVEKITEELISKILTTATGYSEENMEHYDVTLQFSLDGGHTWILATEENFPTEGITVVLPYPEGTNARDYEFVVSHMFTVSSQRLGITAGDVELPQVEETADGIRVTLNGLSPVTVAARYHDHTGGTATCTDKAICSICGEAYGEVDANNHAGGTEIKNAKDATCGEEGYTGDTHCKGCGELVTKGTTIKATGEHTYGKWTVVKEATKTAKGEKQRTCSVCGHVDSEEIPMLTDSPATGDNSNIVLWTSVMCVSTLGLVVLLLDNKRRRSTK